MKDFEKQLAQYTDRYFDTEFVPFPTVEEAVDIILETKGYLNDADGLLFVEAVIELLTEWQKREVEENTI